MHRKVRVSSRRGSRDSTPSPWREQILDSARLIYDLDLKTLVIIRDAARALIDHVAGYTRDSFESDRKTRSAVLFEIILIGEGVKRLSPDLLGHILRFPGPKSLACETASPTRSTPSGYDIVWDVVQAHAPHSCSAISTGSSPRRQIPDGTQEERTDARLPRA